MVGTVGLPLNNRSSTAERAPARRANSPEGEGVPRARVRARGSRFGRDSRRGPASRRRAIIAAEGVGWPRVRARARSRSGRRWDDALGLASRDDCVQLRRAGTPRRRARPDPSQKVLHRPHRRSPGTQAVCSQVSRRADGVVGKKRERPTTLFTPGCLCRLQRRPPKFGWLRSGVRVIGGLAHPLVARPEPERDELVRVRLSIDGVDTRRPVNATAAEARDCQVEGVPEEMDRARLAAVPARRTRRMSLPSSRGCARSGRPRRVIGGVFAVVAGTVS